MERASADGLKLCDEIVNYDPFGNVAISPKFKTPIVTVYFLARMLKTGIFLLAPPSNQAIPNAINDELHKRRGNVSTDLRR